MKYFFSTYFLIALSSLFWNCYVKDSNKPSSKINNSNKDLKIRYLALGDSYTIGENVIEFERFLVQLAYSMRQAGFSVEKLKIIARTG